MPATTRGYSMVKFAGLCLDDAYLQSFELEASPIESQSLQQKKQEKGKAQKIVISVHAEQKCCKTWCYCSEKRGMLSCCKCLFEWIGANLAHFHRAQSLFLALGAPVRPSVNF